MKKLTSFIATFLLALAFLPALSLTLDGKVYEDGSISLDIYLPTLPDGVFSIKERYTDLERDWDSWKVDVSSIAVEGEDYRVDKKNDTYFVYPHGMDNVHISYDIAPMKARGDSDELYLSIGLPSSISWDIDYSFEFPKPIDGDIYCLSESPDGVKVSPLDINGNNVEGKLENASSSTIAFRALLERGYFYNQSRVEDVAIIVLALLLLFSLFLFLFVLFSRARFSWKEPIAQKTDKRPENISPFLSSLYLKASPRMEAVLTSYLLYWKEQGNITIDVNESSVTLEIIKPLSSTTYIEERKLFQLIFGKSLIVTELELKERASSISNHLTYFADSIFSNSMREDSRGKSRRRVIVSLTFFFVLLAGLFAPGLHFGLLNLLSLFCSLSLFLISCQLGRSYYQEMNGISLLGKIRFSAFPLVCYLFLSGYYGYAFSVFSNKAFGFIAALTLALGTFSGAFLSFRIKTMDKEWSNTLALLLGYKEYLEKEGSFDEKSYPYSLCFGLDKNFKEEDYKKLALSLERTIYKIGISKGVFYHKSSRAGFFSPRG